MWIWAAGLNLSLRCSWDISDWMNESSVKDHLYFLAETLSLLYSCHLSRQLVQCLKWRGNLMQQLLAERCRLYFRKVCLNIKKYWPSENCQRGKCALILELKPASSRTAGAYLLINSSTCKLLLDEYLEKSAQYHQHLHCDMLVIHI